MQITSSGASRRNLVFLASLCIILLSAFSCAHVASAPLATSPASVPTEAPSTIAPSAGRAPAVTLVTPAITSQGVEPSASTAPSEDDVQQAEEVEPSPLDELPETTPAVPPATMEKDKSLVAEAFEGFDIPMVLNDPVVAWVEYFTNDHKDLFGEGLVRSGKYVARFQSIFEQAGLPKDLVYMAHVESAFKTNAYSRSKAKGIFQFISETGRRYGLRIDSWIDERSDPEKSAHAAAAYLKDLHDMFGDWYLALAAYNAGEGKVQRALAQTKKSDFWSLAGTRSLRAETKNYVPAILAATMIAKQPGKFGFDVKLDEPVATDVVRIQGQTDLRVLARLADVDPEVMKQLNPHLRRGMTPPGDTTDVRVPSGLGDALVRAYGDLPAGERMILARHHVGEGESLGSIAQRYGVTTNALSVANRLGKSGTIHSGQELIIPAVPPSMRETSVSHGSATAYRVRKGDTLFEIASRYRTTPAAIASANGIKVHGQLSVGQRLVIPGKGTSTRAVARVEHAPAPASIVHTVRRGETLYRIADHYQVTVDQICTLNRIAPDGVLYPGTRLTITATK